MRCRFAAAFALAWLCTVSSSAQDTLPTPESYRVSPERGLEGSVVPEPPTVALAEGELPAGYDPFPTRGTTAHLEIVHWGGGPFRLELTEAEPGAQPEEICVSPCVRDIEPGRYRVSIGRPRSGARNADDPEVYLSRGANVLQIHYDHRVGERSVGWTMLLFGASLGGSLFGLGTVVGLIAGLPTFVILGLAALPFLLLEDSARFEIFQPSEQPDPR
ncbi:MAG: hypothetical protein AB8I08_07345 [Sandaracinaceae bacterium]